MNKYIIKVQNNIEYWDRIECQDSSSSSDMSSPIRRGAAGFAPHRHLGGWAPSPLADFAC